jgi:hypothetical protein
LILKNDFFILIGVSELTNFNFEKTACCKYSSYPIHCIRKPEFFELAAVWKVIRGLLEPRRAVPLSEAAEAGRIQALHIH